ncbi:hypothetical protein RLO149_c004120 [Roseobacter litoralis Och 149]|uniref:Uncharacterized protein n=1 Tax=Roseobacter litoralis (strain ATCC 49566 / DSM 6996 / JCM 21268 / NBRC 15278 / OCh 149) TaxID=391595 RepID=F7ZHN1_ROSLO|nr:hypothetical protein RLO149_c004120 [Roseobacter litoralis Och 149]
MKSHVSGAAPDGEADQETRMRRIWRCVFIPRTKTVFRDAVKRGWNLPPLETTAPTLSDRRFRY